MPAIETVLQNAAKRESEAKRALEVYSDILHRLDNRQITLATAKAQALWHTSAKIRNRDDLQAIVIAARIELREASEEYKGASQFASRMRGF